MSWIQHTRVGPLVLLSTLLLYACGVDGDTESSSEQAKQGLEIDNPILNPDAVLFTEDFETTNSGTPPAGWDNYLGYIYNNMNTAEQVNHALVDASDARSGSQSIHFNGSQSQIVRALPAGIERVHLRAYVKLSHSMGGIQSYAQEHLMGVKGTPDAYNEIRIGQIQGTLGTSLAPSGNMAPTYEQWGAGTSLQAGQWYCVESAIYSDTAYNELYMWVDEQLVHSITSGADWNNGAMPNDWAAGKLNYVMFGFHHMSSMASDVWMDDIVVSSKRIGCGEVTEPVDPIPGGEGDVVNGQTQFEALCMGCHGVEGKGPVVIDNTEGLYGSNNQPLAYFIHDNMPKNDPTLCTGLCARDVAAYILSWEPDTEPVDPIPDGEGDVVNGQSQFEALCMGCHGVEGQGPVVIDNTKALYGSENQALPYFIHDNMPKNDSTLCTGLCARDVAAYILTWQPDTGPHEGNADDGEALYQTNCMGCHGVEGQGNVTIDPTKPVYGENQTLPDFIHDNMPKGNAGNCVDECALDIAAYILTWEPDTGPHEGNADDGETLYETNCMGCHGVKGQGNVNIDPEKSVYGDNQALADFIHDNMPKGNAGNCVGDCALDIAAYILTWRDDDPVVGPISCDVNYGPRMLRILTRNEFSNSIEDLTGVNVLSDLGQSTYDAVPADNMISGFSNNILASVDNGSLQSYELVVNKVVDELAQTDFVDVIDCSADSDDNACAARFIDTYLPKVFRRALDESEIAAYSELFTTEFTGGDMNEGFQLALRTAFTSPQFLYRDETGVSVADIENGNASGTQYQQTGPVQTVVDSNDIKTISIYGQEGSNANFTGDDLIVVTVQGVKSANNGLWPTLAIEANGVTLAQFEVTHTYNKTYTLHTTELSGVQWISIVNKQTGAANEYQGGQDLILSQWEVSAAQAVVPTLPDVLLDDDAYVLTDYQLASYLSFTFTGSTPDDILLAAAASNQLQTDAQIGAQVERLLQTERARQHFGNFAAQWLRTDRVLDMVKDTNLYPTFTPDVRQAMAQEIRDVFNHVVLDEGESFTRLYDGNFTFANQALADFYGFGGVVGEDMQKVTGLTSRAGLVTSGAFLTAHAHEQETAPILRAVYVRKRMMCHDVPPPPTGVSLSGDDFDEAREQARIEWEKYLTENNGLATARKKYEFQTSGSLCLSCHQQMINPLGGGFEDFDAVGLPQMQDYNGLPIDASGTLYGISSIEDTESLSFTGAKGLAHAIAGLDVTRQCFVDNAFRLAMGTGAEKLDPTIDINLSAAEVGNYRCEVNKLDDVMQASGNSTIELLKALGTMDSVRYRKDVDR